jgi:hypothetical protein
LGGERLCCHFRSRKSNRNISCGYHWFIEVVVGYLATVMKQHKVDLVVMEACKNASQRWPKAWQFT